MVDVVNLQRNTARYEFADGIRDFQNAIWYFMLGFYMWLVWDMPSSWLPIVDFARAQGDLFVLLVISIFFSLPLVIFQGSLYLMNEYLRKRWLWKETGFISPRSWVVPRRVVFTAFAIMLVVSAIGTLAAFQFNEGWLMVRAIYMGTGLGIAYMYLTIGNQLQLPRYLFISYVGTFGTLVIVLLPFTAGMTAFVLGTFWAGMLIISGIYAMHHTDRQRREDTNAA